MVVRRKGFVLGFPDRDELLNEGDQDAIHDRGGLAGGGGAGLQLRRPDHQAGCDLQGGGAIPEARAIGVAAEDVAQVEGGHGA